MSSLIAKLFPEAEMFKTAIVNNDYDTLDQMFEKYAVRYILAFNKIEDGSLEPNTSQMLNYLIEHDISKKYFNIRSTDPKGPIHNQTMSRVYSYISWT